MAGGITRSPFRYLFSFFFFLLSLFFSLSISTTTYNSELQILLNIRNELGGYDYLPSWNTSTPHCNWTGIKCNGGLVTEISLNNYILWQPISADVCLLRYLTHLDLSSNQIDDPTFLYNCTNLQYLDLSDNRITGPIPSFLYNCTNLQYLDLSDNGFSGPIPSTISELKLIQYLFLDFNSFIGSLPTELGNLLALNTLSLNDNPFTLASIPSSLGNLTNLRHLNMSYCYLVGHIPESFGMLSNLVGLDLTGNSLKGKIPSGIWMLEKLENLQLSENMLSGDINNTIGAKSLVEIDVSGNNINGSVPEGLTKLHNLTRVVMTGNQLSGVLPAEFGLSPSLCVLQLSSNKLTGFLSLHWANRSKLNTLDLSNNNFSGKIPAAISSLWQLSALDLSYNQISGEIPTAITSLQQLTQLDLSNNQISGGIPTAITSLRQLTQLDLSNNQISGGIPTAITSLRQLTQLNLSNNQISGGIPTAITSLQQLTQLDLSYNQIYGEIPTAITSLPQLTDLYLSNNCLLGKIPTTWLELQNNRLSGPIPPEMGMLKLQYLDLTANKLSGQVPVIFEDPTYRYSFYSNHHLCSRSNFFYKVPKCDQSKISSNILKLLLVIGAVFLLALFTAGLFLRRKLQRPRKSSENLSRTWTITTFHSMQLSDLSIIPQLTDDNLIGRGGAGMVYQMILSEESGHKVAVKKIWNSRKLDEKLEKEFLAEVQILGLIRHKHIVKLFGCLSSSDSKLLVYEYMENGSLDRFLHHQVQGSDSEGYIALDWPTRLRIAIGAAKGLCYMHHDCSPPIVHRDVKSGNILLDSEFNAKIADFGLARILVKAGQPESVSVVAGTFGYMAPECGWSRNVNEKMDVYSFGVVLLELTTGRKAIYGEDYGNLADAVWRHLQETGGVVNLIANEIREARCIEKIESVIKLGIICTGMLPSSRPSMKEVLQVLLWNPRSDQIEDNGENETIQ